MAGGDIVQGVYGQLDTKGTLKAIVSPPWKYIYNCRDKTGELYNLMSDPLELHDRAGEQTDERDKLQGRLLRWAETARRYSTSHYGVELSPEEREKLKGLGYLQ